MSDASATSALRRWWDGFSVYLRRDVLTVIFLGFSAGLPLALSGSTLQIWMRESAVDLKTIGLFAALGAPYTLKFLWAPIVDAWEVPGLTRWLGRRRSWLLLSQILLMIAIVWLGLQRPDVSPLMVAIGALMVAAASATQDIVIDAYRVDKLEPSEQAAGMAGYVAAYRIGMLVSTAGALYIVEAFERLGGFSKQGAWSAAFVTMAAFVLIGMATTLMARPPKEAAPATAAEGNALVRVMHAATGAFSDFLKRDMAWAILAFVVLFKFCDAFAGAMTAPFVIDQGFTRTDYANYVKGVGLIATLLGGFAGGAVAKSLSLVKSLWFGGFLQAVAILSFAWLALIGKSEIGLAVAITLENFTSAIGTVIFVAYMSGLCRNPLYTATQFALISALSSMGRTFLSASAGWVAEKSGWPMFFVIATLTALPGFALLAYLQARGHFSEKPAANAA